MSRGLLISSITLAFFLIASAVGADVQRTFDDQARQGSELSRKGALSQKSINAIAPGTYRSPGVSHKVVIRSEDKAALRRAVESGGVEICDYGTYKLFAVGQAGIDTQSGPGTQSVYSDSYSAGTFSVRDDFNVLLLRSGVIDTTAPDAPGKFLGFAGDLGTEKSYGEQNENAQSKLRLIQFVGPVKRAWLDHLREQGLDPIAYVPNNAYLVRDLAGATERVMAEALGDKGFIQWVGPFIDQYKIHPRLAERMNEPDGGEVTVAIQIARGAGDEDRQAETDLGAAKSLAHSVVIDAYQVLGFTNLKLRIDAGRIIDLARLPNVINIEPWSPPVLSDERAGQIVAGELSADGKQARGPGYMRWLEARGLASKFDFSIDVTDTGLDRGSLDAAKLHPDFLDSAGRSRVVYARDYTSELDPGDIQGHGTINLSIAGGANTSAAQDSRDGDGFNYGLGIAPYAALGSSKIFQSSGRFDLIEPYTKLISEAYRDGARVTSNSWADISNSYSLDSQEYDSRVRDALPGQAGNQEIVICFAAGNAGPGRRVGSPGTGKNVISVAASENYRKTGVDGCGVEDADADSALDMAFFSSGGPLDDGRFKPDITAPGTHVQGAASQHPEFDGSGICGEDVGKPYFPKGQTLYTWSSGTSHSTPQVAGAAALVRQFMLNRGEEPSAALVKAMLLNSTTYLTGADAKGDLPHPRQGWGLLSLGRTFDGASRVMINQTHLFTDSGQDYVITGEVKDSSLPLRVTLAWSDAPGLSAFAPWVNNLDLEVTINGQVYRGNNFINDVSQMGGDANTKDNVESVWLPAGTTGAFMIRIRATNLAGDGVPGNGNPLDQDFALVVYNAERKTVPVATIAGLTLSGGADAVVDPGETVSMRVSLTNVSPAPLTSGRGTLTTSTSGVTITSATTEFASLAGGATGDSLNAFEFRVDRSVACGSLIDFVLEVSSQGAVSRVAFQVMTGRAQPVGIFSDDIESGGSKWVHGSLVKKKKNRVDTWTISSKRFRSGGSSWFTPNLGKITDANLDSVPVQLPADGRNLRLVFYHTFEFEGSEFDGGVIEISTGGDFEDLGPKILQGRYNGTIRDLTGNPLGSRAGWVEGRMGAFQQVVVDLSSYAGKTVVVRFRIGTDPNVKGLGWYVDDVTIAGDRVSCAP